MQTSSHVNEIRQCNCHMCKIMRARGKSYSKWGDIRRGYKRMLLEIIKGADPEDYNKKMTTREYDA